MTHNDIFAVIGEAGPCVDIGDASVGCGHDGIGRFAAFVSLQAADVEAFVQLAAVAAHTAESAGGPGFADGADEELLLAPFLEERVIGGRELKQFRVQVQSAKENKRSNKGQG